MTRTPAVLVELADRLVHKTQAGNTTLTHYRNRRDDATKPGPPQHPAAPSRREQGSVEIVDSNGVVDLNSVARHVGAVDVLYKTRAVAGYTEWSARGPVIQVAVARSDGRRRATLAHECGHLVLDPILNTESFRQFPPGLARAHSDVVNELTRGIAGIIARLIDTVGVERACDLLAYELLLPASEAAGMANVKWTIEQLISTATNKRVSLAMLACRINDYGGDLSLIRLHQTTRGAWLAPTGVGLPWGFRGRITCEAASTTEAIGQAALPSAAFDYLGREPARTTLTFRSNQHTIEVPADIRRVARDRILVLCSRSAFQSSWSENHGREEPGAGLESHDPQVLAPSVGALWVATQPADLTTPPS